MKKLFPTMSDRPGTELIIASYTYWFLCYIFVPFGMVLFTIGLEENTPVTRAWLEIGYHVINGVIAACIMRRYLSDSSYNIGSQKKTFAKNTLLAFLMMAVFAAVGCAVTALRGDIYNIFHVFPIVDQNLFLMTDTAMSVLPVPMILCVTLFVPITICCLFYAISFAPAACKRPWLGYIAVVVLFMAFHGYEYIWHLDLQTAIIIFLLRLPVHLAACWVYQKTDTVWAPVISLSAFNLMTSVIYCVFQ